MSLAVFGKIITAADVEQAVLDHLDNWMPTYIAELERQQGFDPQTVPLIRSYSTVNEWKHWPEDQLPACLVISPGLADRPSAKGGGKYSVKWQLGVAFIASAREAKMTNRLAKLYGAAGRAAILQHRSLGGFATGVEWREERYDNLKKDQDRTVGSANGIYSVEVQDVVASGAGPAEPPADPYVDSIWPTVTDPGRTTITPQED